MLFARAALCLLALVGSVSAADPCTQYSAESACDANTTCTWCKCAAVPSSCYDKKTAAGLPPGVFTCDSLNANTDVAKAQAQWNEFKTTFARRYATAEEEQYRFTVFQSNLGVAARLTVASQGKAEFGVTKFSDLTKEEFKARYLSYTPVDAKPAPAGGEWARAERNTGKSKVKWSWVGNLTTPVKDQGQCGSCWAFSATEQTESMGIKAGKMSPSQPLSVQQIVSCDKNRDEGCNGGDTKTAYKYIIRDGGLEPVKDYPYTSGATGMTGWCLGRDKKEKQVSITGYTVVGHLNEKVMLEYITDEAPLSICVDAESWQTYKRGVVTPATCGTQLDHCVQLTGFDFSKTTLRSDAWLVRNSWNTDWGMKGFIALEYGKNTCGIHNEPTTVTIKA